MNEQELRRLMDDFADRMARVFSDGAEEIAKAMQPSGDEQARKIEMEGVLIEIRDELQRLNALLEEQRLHA